MGMPKEKEHSMNDDFWDRVISKLADKLIEKSDEFSPEQSCPCPVCQNHLKIQIGRYQRNDTKMIGITIECNQCHQAIALDYAEG